MEAILPRARVSRRRTPRPAGSGSCRADAVGGGHGRPARARRRATRRPTRSDARVAAPTRRVGEHDVEPRSGACAAQHLEVLLRGEAGRSPPAAAARLRSTRTRARGRRAAPSRSSGTSRCGRTLVNHEPGPRTTQSAACDRLDRLAGRPAGRPARAGRRRPGPRRWRPRPGRGPSRGSALAGRAATSAAMSSGAAAIGSTRPCAPSSRPTWSRPATGSPSSCHSATISRLPTAWPSSVAVAGEAVLRDLAPQSAPVVVAAQRGQRHPQVTGRQAAELAAQPAARAAVVGDRDDRGQLGRSRAAARAARRPGRGRRRARPPGRAVVGRGRRRSLATQVAVDDAGRRRRRRAAAGRAPRPWRRCGACRRCSRPRAVR